MKKQGLVFTIAIFIILLLIILNISESNKIEFKEDSYSDYSLSTDSHVPFMSQDFLQKSPAQVSPEEQEGVILPKQIDAKKCEFVKIICDPNLPKGIMASKPEENSISMHPEIAKTLSLSCGQNVPFKALWNAIQKSLINPPKNFNFCTLYHEMIHLNDYCTTGTAKLCTMEKNAGEGELQCQSSMQNKYCSPPNQNDVNFCEGLNLRLSHTSAFIGLQNCLCETASVTQETCRVCIDRVFETKSSLEKEAECTKYCRTNPSDPLPFYCHDEFFDLGACCLKKADGTKECQGSKTEAECNNVFTDPTKGFTEFNWYKGKTCAETCRTTPSACCLFFEDGTEECQSYLTEQQCIDLKKNPIKPALQHIWTPDKKCEEVSCNQAKGACCVIDSENPDNPYQCFGDQTWLQCRANIDETHTVQWSPGKQCNEVHCAKEGCRERLPQAFIGKNCNECRANFCPSLHCDSFCTQTDEFGNVCCGYV